MSKALFMRNLRAHWRLVLIFTLVLAMYFLIILGMFDPLSPDIMGQLAAFKLSPALLAAFGFDTTTTELAGFLAGYFYGMLMIALPLVMLVMLGNKLVAQTVERGSLATVLAAPLTRLRVARTQALFLLCCALLPALLITALGLLGAGLLFPGQLDMPAFLRLNAATLCLHLFISGIAFVFSCLFSDTRWSQALGAGLPVFFLLAQMLAKSGSRVAWLRFLTPYTLFAPMDIVRGQPQALQALALLLGGLALYGLGLAVFNKKDLPL